MRRIVIGRFQQQSKVTCESLERIVSSIIALRGIPVFTNVDFGHTNPLITFPIGGRVQVKCEREQVIIRNSR
ncbi:hypothetical protein KRX54_05825 [Actinomycetaceae bacterium TAE3-ERU4]|nr:hypothetical protein [Actinomycetaceae bacterium TAE3-ERU4]